MRRLLLIALVLLTTLAAAQTREHRWAVAQATGEFLYGGVGPPYDVVPGLSPGQIRVVLPRQPQPRLERYSGNPQQPIRPATAAEIAAYDDAILSREMDAALNVKELRALTQATFELQRNPDWTLAQYRARVREIYRSLR